MKYRVKEKTRSAIATEVYNEENRACRRLAPSRHWITTEIELGIIKDSTRQELLAVAKRMLDRHGIEALILGCTELPLILTQDEFEIPFLNTTAIHAEAMVLCSLGLTPND